MKIYILIDEAKRVISANYDRYDKEEIETEMPSEITELGQIHQYIYENDELIYSPDKTEYTVEVMSPYDRIEAQVLYTAMMTDTLMEG